MDAIRRKSEWLLLAAGVLSSVALSRCVLRLGADSLPQMPSDSVLTLVLGDARQQLSLVLFDKVEEYFHGGVRNVVCEEGLAGGREGARHEEHGRAEHGREAPPARASADPWAWLDGQVHVQEHTHLENETAVELLPWIWASCRASPKNVQAFVAGSYVLSRMVGRPEEGARLLEEGLARNPQSDELAFSLGELFMNRLRDPARAEPCFLSALKKNAPAPGKDGEEARQLRLRILFYLGYLAAGKGDADRLRAYAREADAVDPGDVVVKDLHELVKTLESKKE
mgnify:CR=1 FL=1